MSSKFFGNKNEKKTLVAKGVKQTPIKNVPKQMQSKKSGRKGK